MKTLLTLFFTLTLSLSARANLVVELSIENQMVEGTDFYFDVFLTRHADSHGDIFLADMDLVLNFNAQFFTDPVLSVVGNGMDATGFCQFFPTSNLPQAEMDCRAEYFSKTATTEIKDNLLTITLFGPEPPDATAFDGLIAWVDGQAGTHRLGRFKISGINDQMGTAGLVWAETQMGTMTKVFSFENFAPWEGKPVEIATVQPPDVGLDSMVSSTVENVSLDFSIEKIYPNPVGDELNIIVNAQKDMEIVFEVIDGTGHLFFKKIKTVHWGLNNMTFDVTDLPQGQYYLVYGNNNMNWLSKFIKFK